MRNTTLKYSRVLIHLKNGTKSEDINESLLDRYLKSLTEIIDKFLFTKRKEWPGLPKSCQLVEIQILICGDQKIKSLNSEFRGIDKATDVLSFPIFDDLRDSSEPSFEVMNLGDLIINKMRAKKQAQKFGVSIEEEVLHLIVHGFLHLCGFDHEISEDEEKLMEKLEKSILSKISKKLEDKHG